MTHSRFGSVDELARTIFLHPGRSEPSGRHDHLSQVRILVLFLESRTGLNSKIGGVSVDFVQQVHPGTAVPTPTLDRLPSPNDYVSGCMNN